MINYNKKHFEFYTHDMKKNKSKINFIVGENKTNKIKGAYSLVPKEIN